MSSGNQPKLSQFDAIVLAGGESWRMGTPKANLQFGDSSLIGAAVAALKPVFRQVFVVTRDKASLPDLGVEILEDDHPLQGPLIGVVCGLSPCNAGWCFIAACDMPFLSVAVIKSMATNLTDCDALIPEINGRLQTLTLSTAKAVCPSLRSYSAWVIPPSTPWHHGVVLLIWARTISRTRLKR
jgi:molybdopterin-guanine dinucleotide biosynthesis protein A